MKWLSVVGLVVATAGCGAGTDSVQDTDPEVTFCYALFGDRPAAERAAQAGRDAGLDTEVDYIVESQAEHIPPRWGVTFMSFHTGENAREARTAYRQIRRQEGGKSGHGKTGCLERPPFG
jgi:hypothetical protein